MSKTEIKKLSQESLEDFIPFFKGYKFKKYFYYSEIEEEQRVRYFYQTFSKNSRDRDSEFWVIKLNHDIIGLASLRFLKWDTEQLGISTGTIGYFITSYDCPNSYEMGKRLLKIITRGCADKGIKYLTIRLNSNELLSIHLLEDNGFVTLDGILTYAYDLKVSKIKLRDKDFHIRPCRIGDIDCIRKIAYNSFSYDRFHSDPKIPKRVADNLHSVWLENSCRGNAADAVLVGTENRNVVGFITCKVDKLSKPILGIKIGTIVLVAITEGARGRGVASALTNASLGWFKEQGVDIVEVGTQLRNIPASRLYEKIGFSIVSSSISMRRWFG